MNLITTRSPDTSAAGSIGLASGKAWPGNWKYFERVGSASLMLAQKCCTVLQVWQCKVLLVLSGNATYFQSTCSSQADHLCIEFNYSTKQHFVTWPFCSRLWYVFCDVFSSLPLSATIGNAIGHRWQYGWPRVTRRHALSDFCELCMYNRVACPGRDYLRR